MPSWKHIMPWVRADSHLARHGCLVLGMLWRHLGAVREAVRVLHEEGMLWMSAIEDVSPQIQQMGLTIPRIA